MAVHTAIGVFLICIQIIPSLGFLGATDQHGDCQAFPGGHPSYAAGTCYYCLTQGFRQYCKTYQCQPVNCANPDTSSCCQSCPGTCNYDGTIAQVGTTFRCLDNTAVCLCLATGRVLNMFNTPGTQVTNAQLDSFCNIQELG